jgi:hypothetical protein
MTLSECTILDNYKCAIISICRLDYKTHSTHLHLGLDQLGQQVLLLVVEDAKAVVWQVITCLHARIHICCKNSKTTRYCWALQIINTFKSVFPFSEERTSITACSWRKKRLLNSQGKYMMRRTCDSIRHI